MARDENNEVKAAQARTAAAERAKTDDDTMEIDLLALFFCFLEKIHWIILAALLAPDCCPRRTDIFFAGAPDDSKTALGSDT